MRDWYATFGSAHEHPLTGESLKDCYTLVPAATYHEAHELMIRSVFGRQWAFVYEHADLPDEQERAAGVVRWGLREIPFIAPSPLSDVVWAAFAKLPVLPDLWVDAVSQPVELAWHRYEQERRDALIRSAAATARRAAERVRATAAAMLTPDASDLPRSAEEEPAEAASPPSDRSLTPQVAQPADDPR